MNINEYIEEYRATEGALLVDLREAEDYKRSHIPGAIHILPGQIRDEIRKLATFRTPIYLYCYAGIRSAQAAELLKTKGYQVFNIGSFEEYTGEKEGEGIRMDLKELRKEKGLSQAAMAQSIGVKPVTISAIETGRMKVSPRIAELVRSAFGVEVEVPEPKKRGVKPDKEKASRKPAGKRAAKGQGKRTGRQKKAAPSIVYQTAQGNEISEAEILAKVGEADHIYVRLDENKAYWVRGEESGSIALW